MSSARADVDPRCGTGRRPTLHDVAERAGVSKSLASLVMRNEPMVREEKRLRVLRAASELGYSSRITSRRPTPGRYERTVAIVVADLHSPLLLDVLETAASVLEEAGVGILVMRAGSRLHVSPRRQHVRALLVVGTVPTPPTCIEAGTDLPVVVAAADAGGARADVVRCDDRLGMRLVVDYLFTCGHRSIAHLGGTYGRTAQERLAGYRAAMLHHGLSSEIVTVESDFTEDGGYRATAQLLRGDTCITAIAAVNDMAAVGALSAAADAGVSVPHDLAVTGYDDSYMAAIRQVSLTSVNSDNAGIGARAARCLLRRMADPTGEPQEHLLPPRLVTRFSSGRPSDALRCHTPRA